MTKVIYKTRCKHCKEYFVVSHGGAFYCPACVKLFNIVRVNKLKNQND